MIQIVTKRHKRINSICRSRFSYVTPRKQYLSIKSKQINEMKLDKTHESTARTWSYPSYYYYFIIIIIIIIIICAFGCVATDGTLSTVVSLSNTVATSVTMQTVWMDALYRETGRQTYRQTDRHWLTKSFARRRRRLVFNWNVVDDRSLSLVGARCAAHLSACLS